MKPPQTFVQKYIVTIVMVPSIIGIHLGWNYIQKSPALVKEEEQMELPVVKTVKYIWKNIQETSKENTK